VDSEKKIETKERELPIQGFIQRKPFEVAAQDVGGVKKQIGMLLTWGMDPHEREFTRDVAAYVQKIKGERRIEIRELKSMIEVYDELDKGKGKDYWEEEASLQRKKDIQQLQRLREMLKLVEKHKLGISIDLHCYPFPFHNMWELGGAKEALKSKEPEKNSPLIQVRPCSQESSDEYSKVSGIDAIILGHYAVRSRTYLVSRTEELKAKLTGRKVDENPMETAETRLNHYFHAEVEGIIWHGEHKEGEKCEVSREVYEKAVVATGDAVIRIYDHFNSKLLNK
jgi:hypothetical protein